MTRGSLARLPEIDIAKGLGISLVVFGHLVARNIKPIGVDWYQSMHEGLYSFHLSIFFFLAGYVYWLAPYEVRRARLGKSVSKLLSAYAFFAILAFFGKALAGAFFSIDRPIGGFVSDWLGFFLYPTEGFVTFLWFIPVLLVLYLIASRIRTLDGAFGLGVISLALAAHLLSTNGFMPKLFAIQQISRYLLFFLLASYAVKFHSALNFERHGLWMVAALLMCVCFYVLPNILWPTIVALLSLTVALGFSRFLAKHGGLIAVALAWLGQRSWPIYLMNVFAIGAVKLLVLRYIGWDYEMFYVAAPILLASGLLLPVLVQRFVFARFTWVDRFTR
ncbi:MAG: acyltransferase family protein [Burkholderiaceae bacterium]|nr:acyltransferase family protein [Burkholderiaceae bacterium]